MRFILIANPPPGVFYGGLLTGAIAVAAILWAFLGTKPRLGWRRLIGLCIFALVLGPVASAGLACLTVMFGDVDPLDRSWLIRGFACVGTVAGVVVAVLIGIIGGIRASGQRSLEGSYFVKRFLVPLGLGLIVICAGMLVYRIWFFPIAAEIVADETVNVDGLIRHYRLVIPNRLPQERVPIVFAFHGIGDSSTEEMAAYSGLDRLAAENGFILVYPAARKHVWATMNIEPENLDRNPDVRFFDQLLGHLGERFRLDPNRIYLVGMSNGAAFAQLVAFVRPNIAAVVAHSGTRPIELTSAIRPFPILLLAGEDDTEVDGIRSDATQYHGKGHAVELIVIPGLGHEWSTAHNRAMWAFLSKHPRD
jgi:poly(3-hydroxybutyrate) depolymerase